MIQPADTPYTKMTDEQSVVTYKGASEEDRSILLEVVWRRYYPRLENVALRLTNGDYALAEDITQEAFISAMRSFENFEGNSKIMTWLREIVVNAVRDELRRKKRKEVQSLDELAERGDRVFDERADQDDGIYDLVGPEKLYELIDLLPQKLKETTLLCMDIGVHRQVAEMMGCPAGTVKSRMHRARLMIAAMHYADELSIGMNPPFRGFPNPREYTYAHSERYAGSTQNLLRRNDLELFEYLTATRDIGGLFPKYLGRCR